MKYCTGCGGEFESTHLLKNHRRTFRCGGEFNNMVILTRIPYCITDDGEYVTYKTYRHGNKYDPDKPALPDVRSDVHKLNKRQAFSSNEKKIIKTHKGRKPGTTRPSRMLGGSGFRNNWEGK